MLMELRILVDLGPVTESEKHEFEDLVEEPGSVILTAVDDLRPIGEVQEVEIVRWVNI